MFLCRRSVRYGGGNLHCNVNDLFRAQLYSGLRFLPWAELWASDEGGAVRCPAGDFTVWFIIGRLLYQEEASSASARAGIFLVY